MTALTWEEGVIGRIETFLLKRFPIGKMWARSNGLTMVSSALSDVILEDFMGDVRPNVFVLYIAVSGLGCKTPPIKMIRRMIAEFDRKILSATKFTPEGFTEWVLGVSKKKIKKGDGRIPMEKHPNNFVIKDEASKIIGEVESKYLANKEFLSQLWDCWIEGYLTRKYHYEGAVPVYVVMLLAGSDVLFDVLDENFFKQGLGNRILWIIEEPKEPKKHDPKTFFFSFGATDTEFHELKKHIIDMLHQIADTARGAFIDSNAAKMWVDYQYECAMKAYKSRARVGSYEIKQPLNALKLAICYAASRLSISNGIVMVVEQDMERAIKDMRIYNEMWFKAMEWWETVKGRKEKREKSPSTSKYALREIMDVAVEQKDYLFSAGTIRGIMEIPDINRITKILLTGRDKGWLEIAAETGSQGDLTDEQYKRFKPNRGFYPRIWRVTEEGKRSTSLRYKTEGQKNDT